VRPLNDKEQTVSEFETIKVVDGRMLVLLDPEANQDDVPLSKN
jgi:kinesin family protein 18/19